MFCKKCGSQNGDNATHCSKCGAELIAKAPVDADAEYYEYYKRKKRGTRKKLLGFLTACAAIAVIAILFIDPSGSLWYRSAVRKYFSFALEGDVDAYFDIIHEDVLEEILDRNDMYKAQYRRELESTLSSRDSWLGDDWDCSYDIISVKNIKGESLEDIQLDFNEDYHVHVEAAKQVSVIVTLEFGGDIYTEDFDITVIRIGMLWYIDINEIL